MFLHALTIFLSAFLLFLVQPIIAKQILPWFGGSAAVWSTCLVFFQVTLLAGYLYADWTTRRLNIRRQTILHAALLAVALLLLPIVPAASWKPIGAEQPSLQILLLLTVTIGLPYFLLSTTSPLIQVWFARAYPGVSPYRLFALSNLASMLALLGYPFLLEPNVATRFQAIYWSAGFGVFALTIAIILARAYKTNARSDSAAARAIASADQNLHIEPTSRDKAVWVALSALGSMLLLGVSNHLTQNIASIPLLWLAPLAIYLLTFILCFGGTDGSSWYPRGIALSQAALAVVAMAWLLAERKLDFMLYLQIAVFSVGLFMTCMYCHGELVARKPPAQHLTTFYLMISIGGAAGSILIGILAPLILPAYFELGLTLVALAALATWLFWRQGRWQLVLMSGGICAFALWSCVHTIRQYQQDVVVMSRNFYGTLRVKEFNLHSIDNHKRSLLHGAILHGDQFMDARRRVIATTYYRNNSGIAIALREKDRSLVRPRRVGIVGLGAGTLATYGNKNDVFRFYEINPDVVEIAKRDFTYLQESMATVEVSLGDARLTLERESSQHFDVLAIDAFSGDSIPVHLITLEALDSYQRHMEPDGIIAFHVSNRFLDLTPVVGKLANARGLAVAWIRETHDDGRTASDWVLLSKDPLALQSPAIVAIAKPIVARAGTQVWTDDFNNLVEALK